MKQLINVIKFETATYFQSKGYFMGTIILSALLFFGLFLPNIIDLPFLNTGSESTVNTDETESRYEWGIYDKGGVLENTLSLEDAFPIANVTLFQTEEELKAAVKGTTVEYGFILNSPTDYTYLVNNTGLYDNAQYTFEAYYASIYQYNTFTDADMDYAKIVTVMGTPISSTEEILGTDGQGSYWYVYLLIMIIYIMPVFYGQMVATAVTTEKSSRTIEVLITSTSSNSLIFGKVIASTIATLFQLGLILGSALVSYSINRDAWGGMLDIILDIPTNALVVFAFFGIFGYLLTAFIYAALGSLVSKTEDIGKSVMPITMILMISFFAAMMGLNMADSTFVVVGSYIPFFSNYLMLVRVAMGTVQIWEIIISMLILLGTNIVTGLLVAKIYRMGTLMIGNPIKLSSAFKMLKQNND